MRFWAVAGNVVIAVTVIGGAIALGIDGAGSQAAQSVVATEAGVPHTGCAEAIRHPARPKRGRDLIAGPVAFYKTVNRSGEAVADSDEFEREAGERYMGFKAGAIVKRDTVATIIVPRSERPELKIDYSVDHKAGFANTLEACDDRRTGFPGGFKVHGPLCTKLRVRVEGRPRPITKPVSFGAGRCG